MKKNILLHELDDIDAGQQEFKLSLGNLISFSKVSMQKMKLLEKISTALVKKRNSEKEDDGSLNETGIKYDRLNNECKILFYKIKYYKELCEKFYGNKNYTKKAKLFDDIIPFFLEFANNEMTTTNEFKNLKDFNQTKAVGLEIIKMPNTIVKYENTYKKDIDEAIGALEGNNNNKKIKTFIIDFKSLLQEEVELFLEKIKTIEGRIEDDPPEESEESNAFITKELYDSFIKEVKPYVIEIYKDPPLYKVNSSGDLDPTYNKYFEDVKEFINSYVNPNLPPFNQNLNNNDEIAKITSLILNDKLSNKNLVQILLSQAEKSDSPNYSEEEIKQKAGDIKDQRIGKLIEFFKKLSQLKKEKETTDVAAREIGFNNFLKVSQKLYNQFTTKNENYPLFIEPETDDMKADIKLTSPYADNTSYTRELMDHFENIKETLIILGQDKNIIKNRYKNKESEELKDILKDLIKLKKLRNKEIYRDIVNIYRENNLERVSGGSQYTWKNTVKDLIMGKQGKGGLVAWYRNQTYEDRSYEKDFLSAYAKIIELLKNNNKQQQATNNQTGPGDIQEHITKLIKPLIREKLKRKQNGKKNLRN